MMVVIKYVFGFALIGLLGWFAYKQVKGIIASIKERKRAKLENEKTQSDEKKEE